MALPYVDTTLIVPTLNEEKNIGELLKIITRLYKGMQVIVADDGSTDQTARIVKAWNKKHKNVILLNRAKFQTKGLTASVIDAVKKTTTDYFVVIDGDLQHPPERIKDIVKKLRSGADIVAGYRKKVATDWPVHRRLMSEFATLSGKLRLLLTGTSTTDIMSGFFGCRTFYFMQEYDRRPSSFVLGGYKVLFDLLKWAPKYTKLAEVGYIFGARLRGESKISTKHIILYGKSLVT